MRYFPRKGLNVPTITVVDDRGEVIEAEQRRVFRHVAQNGRGADVIFANGTTGEWNCLANPQRQRLMAIAVDEVQKINAELQLPQPVEVWLGLNGSTRAETLDNLDAAIRLGADAAVIAPLAIDDLEEAGIVRFFQREIDARIEAARAPLPVFLYDNADINSPGRSPHIRTRIVKDLSRLPWISGIKVSAPRRVLGNYTKAALHFKQPSEFGIYVGNANLIFDWFRPRRGWIERFRQGWLDWLLHYHLPIGVVSGPGNVFPREWRESWRVCWAGDEERMDAFQQMAEEFEAITAFDAGGNQYTGKMIACLKYALELEGIIASSRVAGRTLALTDAEREAFQRRYADLKASFGQRLDSE